MTHRILKSIGRSDIFRWVDYSAMNIFERIGETTWRGRNTHRMAGWVGLEDFVSEAESSDARAKTYCRQNSPLTINQSAAIYLYSMMGPFYRKLNEALRAENQSARDPMFPYLKLFLTAVNKIESYSTTVWRGVRRSIGNQFAVGAVHTWSGLNSCSPHVNVAGSFTSKVGTLFCIHTIHGKDITTFAANQTEEEIPLRPGIRLRVKSVKLERDGVSLGVVLYLYFSLK